MLKCFYYLVEADATTVMGPANLGWRYSEWSGRHSTL